MKKLTLFSIFLCLSLGFVAQAKAQENYTEGPVWVINYYRTKPGKFDEYMKFLRANFLKNIAKQKEAKIIVDAKVLVNPTISGPDDWDVAICYLYSDYSKLNFDQAVFDKLEKFAEEISGEKSADKRDTQLDATRFPLRDYLRTRFLREIMLKP
jgi:hypothetical protein